MNQESVVDIAKTLAEAHLESIFQKFVVIGYHTERGDEFFSNCNAEQLGLLMKMFGERLVNMQAEAAAAAENAPAETPSTPSQLPLDVSLN